MSFVLNPETNRYVKVGSKKFRELVRHNILENVPTEKPKPIHEAKNNEEAAEYVTKLNKNKIGMKKNTSARRRGNKVYEWSNTLHQEDIAEYTAKAASRTLHKNMDSLAEKLEDAYENNSDDELGDFEHNLKNLILQEMINPDVAKKPTTNMRKGYKKQQPETEYEIDPNYSGDDCE